MRISAGEFRGRILKTPKGEATRPTSGMIRETLFNILNPIIADSRFLDLFAGCGSVGLEALSRGAASATFVEKGRPALDCLRSNILQLGVEEYAVVLPYAVDRALDYVTKAAEQQFDIIFLDPPFHDEQAYLTVLRKISSSTILAPAGIVVAQHAPRVHLPESMGRLERYRERAIGDNVLSFYRHLSID